MNQGRMSIKTSADVEDIITLSRRSAEAKGDVCLLELGSLDDIIPLDEAEVIRQAFLANGTKVRQLTNQTRFDAWTEVDGFVERCMQVRHLAARELPIRLEMLLFDDVVALYRVEPEVSVTIIQDADFAAQQRALFDAAWANAEPLQFSGDGSTV